MASIEKVLRAVSPKADARFVAASAGAGAIMAEFGIRSVKAQAQIIGHMAVECAGFRTFSENLNYSAARLTQVWSGRFPTLAAAQPYAKNPKALANKVYNGRMGNRPNSDDGWNYRGSGALQHTGQAEFARVNRRTGIDVLNMPDKLRDVAYADAMWRAACSYFVDRGALAAADRGETLAVTKAVNGGTNGLEDRKIMVARAVAALAGDAVTIVEKTTHEQADDAKRRAKQATAAAPAGGAAGGGATDQAQQKPAPQPQGKSETVQPDKPVQPAPATDHTIGILVGVIVFAVIGVVAAGLWRKAFHKQAAVETLQLERIEERLAAAAS
jgi:putative chitinase